MLGKAVLVDSRPGRPHVRFGVSQCEDARPDLLRTGSDWLAEMLKEHASRPVVYRRGTEEVAVQAIIGRKLLTLDDGYGGALALRVEPEPDAAAHLPGQPMGGREPV